MTDWTGPDSYTAVIEALFVAALIVMEVSNIRWRARIRHRALVPAHTRANTLAWIGLLLSVLLLIGSFTMSVFAPVSRDNLHHLVSSGLLVGLAYLATLASAFSIGSTAVRARRHGRTVDSPRRKDPK